MAAFKVCKIFEVLTECVQAFSLSQALPHIYARYTNAHPELCFMLAAMRHYLSANRFAEIVLPSDILPHKSMRWI
ncbi:hypothetical protein [Shinella sp. M27]|uniref:hypothetical protein n=1 Tax=Shinella sp. M27 TaxID=3368614 RepID=UPI003BA25725